MNWYIILAVSLTLSTIAFIFGFLLGCESIKAEIKELRKRLDIYFDDEHKFMEIKTISEMLRRILE